MDRPPRRAVQSMSTLPSTVAAQQSWSLAPPKMLNLPSDASTESNETIRSQIPMRDRVAAAVDSDYELGRYFPHVVDTRATPTYTTRDAQTVDNDYSGLWEASHQYRQNVYPGRSEASRSQQTAYGNRTWHRQPESYVGRQNVTTQRSSPWPQRHTRGTSLDAPLNINTSIASNQHQTDDSHGFSQHPSRHLSSFQQGSQAGPGFHIPASSTLGQLSPITPITPSNEGCYSQPAAAFGHFTTPDSASGSLEAWSSPTSSATGATRRSDPFDGVDETEGQQMQNSFPYSTLSQQFGSGYVQPLMPGPQGFMPSVHLVSMLPNSNAASLEPGLTYNGIPSFSVPPDGPKPGVAVLFNPANMPFIESARQCGPAAHGVVRLVNIPYGVTRAEIIAFLGRSAKIIPESEEPIHIIMERVTSKTMDAYVEFINISEATNAIRRYENGRLCGRSGRLGERHIDMELVGQDELMKDLFPKAKNVQWRGARPHILPTDPNDPTNSGFRGFVSSEELVMLCKHVENPHRSPFSKDCPQRPFESLISTLLKYPWYMVDNITANDRNLLYMATVHLLRLLKMRVEQDTNETHLTEQLLRRVRRAAIRCAGFSETMRDNICYVLGFAGESAGLPMCAHLWPFSVIGAKRNFSRDVLWYYINLLRLGTTARNQMSLAEQSAKGRMAKRSYDFGYMKVVYPSGAQDMTLAQLAVIEWGLIENVLRRAVDA